MKQKEVIAAGADWKTIPPSGFIGTPFERIGKGWMLITAGDVKNDKGYWNTMTASCGGLGVLWGKYTAIMYIRPSRYTFEFSEKSDIFTLSFFDESKREALNICGSKTGRDTDKAAAAGLTPIVFEDLPAMDTQPAGSAVSFGEAADILICRKLYACDFDPSKFLDPSIENNYRNKDYHKMYIGEIISVKTR